ncbi:MAG TPA: hypothetical protein DCP28_28925, partial [Cytophagales bacterium]|nr:hypothetical protein [Cytophagales bacterium]
MSVGLCVQASAQVANDSRVLLQGFYWEASHDRTGDWYEYVQGLAPEMASAGIDMIWLPPPSDAGSLEGYLPRELNNFSNNYGTLAEHQAMLSTLDGLGIDAIADIVVNHRVGSTNWVDFTNPTWGTWSITSNDEVWSQPAYSGISTRGNNDTGTPYAAARDVDHTNTQVQNDIIAFMNNLKAIGYDGWRYDFVHGFGTQYFAQYNGATNPTFSVGENWTQDKQAIQNWIDATGSAAFDFPTYYAIKGAIRDNNYSYLAYQGEPSGGIGWDPRNNVTFVENHDTPDYDPQNNILNGNNVGQAYAYLLTHPGVPTIYWSHMFEWGNAVKDEIKASLAVRKDAGIHSQSGITILEASAGVYAARIAGTNHDVILKMGGGNWGDPGAEGISGNWALATYGTNYAIWTNGGTGGGGGGGGGQTGEMTVYAQGFTHVYAWDDNQNPLAGAWPGAAMSSAGNGWYSYTLSSDCANVIFSNNGGGQTADLSTCNSTPWYYEGTWYAEEPNTGGGGGGGGSGSSFEVFVQGYTHFYAWDDNQNPLAGGWPGTALSADGAWMKGSIPANCTNVIFSNNGGNQTADLSTCSNAPYYYQGTWHASDPTSGGGGGGSSTMTVYAQNYTHAYAWDDNQNPLLGGWPGTAMSSAGGGWNSVTINASCANVIFSYNGGSQTADLNTCG